MAYLSGVGSVYYHFLEGNDHILADERSKKKFLDFVFALYRERDWRIYAFCITDSGAYFITETEVGSRLQEDLQRAADNFLQWYRCNAIQISGDSLFFRAYGEERINSVHEIALRCRQIHQIPLKVGYVHRIGDYWWSSYITYMGGYRWERVDCQPLAEYFSMNPETAKRKIRQFHKGS